MDTTYVGIDVSKDRLDVHVLPQALAFAVTRDGKGVAELIERLGPLGCTAVAVEATGGFETVVAPGLDVHGRNYDPPENYLEEQFQDFGITHVHNSLIYDDGASNIGVVGPGMLHGLGIDREGPGDRW